MRGAVAFAFLLLATPALAERVAVRIGDHPDHGRVVLDLAAPNIPYRVEEGAEGTLIRLSPDLSLDLPARRPPRNVQSLSAESDGLRIALRPGARLRHYRLGNRLVLDALDAAPPSERNPKPAASPRATPAPEAAPAPRRSPPAPGLARTARPIAPSSDPAIPAAGSAPEPTPVPVAAPTPPPPRAPAGLPLRVVEGPSGRALALPLPAETGLAMLRRGDTLLIVLDQPQALDTTSLQKDPIFVHLQAEQRPDSTILRLPIAAPAALQARRDGDRWLLTPKPSFEQERSILAEADSARLILRVSAPGRPIPVTDPETGLPLLVGTVREPGQSIAAPRSLSQADLLPTQLGIAALARSDSAALRRSGERFILSGAGTPSSRDTPPDAAPMTTLMDLPFLDAAAAQTRLRAQQASIAAAPPLARLPLRRATAEGLLALGLAQEAQAMIRLAFREDPRASADPRSLLIHAAAALLAGRPAEAQPLAAGTIPPSDELTLWRALLAARNGEAEAAARGFAATQPLLLAYPEPLRARLLPAAAEAMLEGKELPAARRLLRAAGDRPDLAYARARLTEAEGREGEALSLYAALANGRDRDVRARALHRSIELRLASGALDAAGAAAALDATLFAWRGGNEELTTRLRIATLLQTAGKARAALDLLKDTAEAFPDRLAQLRPAQEEALLHALAQESPATAVALSEAHSALLPQDARGAEALSQLADRLAAMDLPDRAASLAMQALQWAAPAQKPALSLRLATLRLSTGDALGALAALELAPATPEQAESRALLTARAKAALGDTAGALDILRGLGTPGLPALAAMLAERQDWTAAAAALEDFARARPGDTALPSTLLRAAAFAALGGDAARLAALRAHWLSKLGEGPVTQAFNLLTTDPVRAVSDLPRLDRELNLFRQFPNGLEAFRTARLSSG
jgi:hypothetical protein